LTFMVGGEVDHHVYEGARIVLPDDGSRVELAARLVVTWEVPGVPAHTALPAVLTPLALWA